MTDGRAAGPWRVAARRLRRQRLVLVAAAVFVLLIAASFAAPLWANLVADTGPHTNHVSDTVTVDGVERQVVGFDGIPIGPTWEGKFFLGADENGRDIMVRLLYGGRNSLLIGLGAALLTALLATGLGIVAGFFRGAADAVISRALDVIWAFPVLLLGIALGVALSLGGLQLGPVTIAGDSKWIPVLVIALVYVPYMARPIRGQVVSLREREFVQAARVQGAGPLRLMTGEIFPNVVSMVIVFVPLLVANAVLLEAALSFLGAGVRPPEPSWGTMIDSGVDRLITAPHQAIVPGVMLVLTVLSLNVVGDAVRDALDPRTPLRVGRG